MARHWFGLTLTDWTFTAGDSGQALLTGSVPITFWSERSGGSQYTDLLDENGSGITSVTSSDGTDLPLGTIPRFQSPDGVTFMWADVGGSTRYLMVATDLGDMADLLETVNGALSAHLAALNPHGTTLSALDDVNAPTPSDGQALGWDVATERWIPVTFDGVSNVVTLDTSQTITAPKILQLEHGNTTDTFLFLRFSGDREEAASVLFAEWNQGSEGSPSWRRAFELNEYAMVRVTAPVVPQTMMRLRADPSNTAAAFEVTDLSNVAKMWIESTTGLIRAPNISTVPPFAIVGAVSTGVGALRWYNDTGQSLTIRNIRVTAGTAPTGASLIVDVNKNGSTIFSTQANRPTITAGNNTSGKVTAINTTTLADGDYLTVDIDQVGSTVAGSNLTVQILAY